MSRIFLSHSSVDELEAVALRDWLAQNGWDDVFLDLDPQRGLLAGERWQEALRRAADRCEAVVFIVTPAWAQSKWCLAEFLLAKSLNKHIFGAILKRVELSELPTELTSEWQLSHLAGDGPKSAISFSHKGRLHQIGFLTEGLTGLRIGLEKAGLDARYFPWPPPDDPKRPPYRGLVPLEEKDAAIYFGRDAQIIRGLDALRSMRATGVETLFVILGPSGCGKSSFLRAGLLPRLKRDDRHFLPLEIIRPERQPITGERGLSSAIHKAGVDLDLAGQTLGAIKTALMQDTGQLSRLLSEIQGAARARLRATSEDAAPPTLLLSIDQAEELFNPDATDESRRLLALVGTTLRDADANRPLLIVAFTIRSDRYEPLQTADELTGLKGKVFDDLKPMPSQQFKEVITGPAHRATLAGNRLEIKPDLVDQLLSDCALGADTLPLLSLTLSRLYRDYGSDGDLLLDEYRTMGGMGSMVNNEVELVLARDAAEREAQLDQLHAAFIPWLARINPETDEPMRRRSRYADLPAESRTFIDGLAERRLLVIDQSNGEKVVEVAHEALFRQWGELANWLEAEREDLKLAHALEQAAWDWHSSGRKADWLMEGERLAVAEALAAKPTYRGRLAPVSEFLLASRQRETERQEEEERQRQAELVAAREKQAAAEALAKAESESAQKERRYAEKQRQAALKLRRLAWVLAALALLATVAGVFALRQKAEAEAQKTKALRAERETRQTASQGQVSLARRLKESGDNARALAHLAQALRLNPENDEAAALTGAMLAQNNWALSIAGPIPHFLVFGIAPQLHRDGLRVPSSLLDKITALGSRTTGKPAGEKRQALVLSAQFSPDGQRVVTGSVDKTARLWDAATGEPIGDLMKHDGQVNSVQFSPDGQRVVTGSVDKTARLWDGETGKPIGDLMKHDGQVDSVQFSPDGQRVLTTSSDRTARLWDGKTGEPIGELMKHDGSINSAQFSPDGRRVATASSDKTARLWDAATGEPIGESMKHNGSVDSAEISPDGSEVVTVSKTEPDDQIARRWDAATGKPIGEPLRHEGKVAFAHFSPDSQRIVTVSGEKTARLWEAATGKAIGEPMKHHGTVHSARFSSDGQRVVTVSSDKRARLWDATTGKPIVEPIEHQDSILSAEFSPDGQWVVTTTTDSTLRKLDGSPSKPFNGPMMHEFGATSAEFDRDGERVVTTSLDDAARIWDAATGKAIGKPMKHENRVLSAQFSPNGQRIVTASADKTARLWDAATGEPIGDLMKHDGQVNSAEFSPDGQRVVTASMDRTARIWNSKVDNAVGTLLEHEGKVLSAHFSPDGRQVVTASADKTARLWDAETGKPIGESMKHGGVVNSAQFSPDGWRVVTACSDNTARLWDGKTGKPIGASMKHDGKVSSAKFSPDGDGARVVTASSDNTARLWDGKTGKPVGASMKHDGQVTSAEFSSDGRRIVTASLDRTARLWDGKTGKPVSDPMQHRDEVTSARFSPNGQRIVTASMDHTARLWDIPTVSVMDTTEDARLLADLAEAMAGTRLPDPADTNVFQVLSAIEVSRTREKINANLGTKSSELTPLQRYLEWSLKAKRSRTISPFSRITFAEWIEHTIDEGTLDDLWAAIKADPANARLSAHLGRRLADLSLDGGIDPTTAQQARAEADFQTRRAVKLAPDNAEIIKVRAEVANLLQLSAE